MRTFALLAVGAVVTGCGESAGTRHAGDGGSRLLQRVVSEDALMPPISVLAPDPLGVELLDSWIASLLTCTVEESNP